MKINCVSCGHSVGLDQAYDDFEGIVKCYVCGAMLHLKTEEGKVKSVSINQVIRRSESRTGVSRPV